MPTLTTENLALALADHGLSVRGYLQVAASDELASSLPDGCNALWLVGHVGSSIWPVFNSSPEYQDGKADPLNRWSERVGEAIAHRFAAQVLFPFGGPPYQPFLAWAKAAEGMASSRLGMLIHPQEGLWHAYRFAIAAKVPEVLEPMRSATDSALSAVCVACEHQRCLSGCPVRAFTVSGYDTVACAEHLQQPDNACLSHGCQARHACPVGAENAYQPAHANFHMSAFLRNRLALKS